MKVTLKFGEVTIVVEKDEIITIGAPDPKPYGVGVKELQDETQAKLDDLKFTKPAPTTAVEVSDAPVARNDAPKKRRTPFNRVPNELRKDRECVSCHRTGQAMASMEYCKACYARKRYAEKRGREFVPGLPGKVPPPELSVEAKEDEYVTNMASGMLEPKPTDMDLFMTEFLEGDNHEGPGHSGSTFKCYGCGKNCLAKNMFDIKGDYNSFKDFEKRLPEICWEKYEYEPPIFKKGLL
jgi:hypothetical protein